MTAAGMRDAIRHRMNPLHVYCRLTPILRVFGVDRARVRQICKIYERLFYPSAGRVIQPVEQGRGGAR